LVASGYSSPVPDPPPVSLVTRYVLENPYPVAVLLVCLAGGLLWRLSTSQGASSAVQRRYLFAGLLAAAAAVAVFVTGTLIVTSGEQARALTRRLVEAAAVGDVAGCFAEISLDARLTFGAATNPAHSRAAIDQRVSRLDGRYRLEDNDITMLDAYSRGADRAVVHLACRTTPAAGYGPVFTQWVLECERQPDGAFQVTHIRWVTINGRSPAPDLDR
jgi:hypothetical protein